MGSRERFPSVGYPNVRPYAHVELASGFVVFDDGPRLQVMRNRQAIELSAYPSPENGIPRVARPHIKALNGRYMTTAAVSPNLPELLRWYKALTPPTPCRAFRARTDERTGRAMLATAGIEAIYLWDLDEGSYEAIPITDDDQDQDGLNVS